MRAAPGSGASRHHSSPLSDFLARIAADKAERIEDISISHRSWTAAAHGPDGKEQPANGHSLCHGDDCWTSYDFVNEPVVTCARERVRVTMCRSPDFLAVADGHHDSAPRVNDGRSPSCLRSRT